MSRRTAREVAMKLAFSRLLGGESTYQSILNQSDIEENPTDSDIAFANEIYDGILSHADEIDSYIGKHSIGWKIERMPRVDLCILRVAVYEILYCETIPSSVSINEAVELSKRFGGERSSAYINGILGAVEKEANKK